MEGFENSWVEQTFCMIDAVSHIYCITLHYKLFGTLLLKTDDNMFAFLNAERRISVYKHIKILIHHEHICVHVCSLTATSQLKNIHFTIYQY